MTHDRKLFLFHGNAHNTFFHPRLCILSVTVNFLIVRMHVIDLSIYMRSISQLTEIREGVGLTCCWLQMKATIAEIRKASTLPQQTDLPARFSPLESDNEPASTSEGSEARFLT